MEVNTVFDKLAFFKKLGMKSMVIGCSGGVDSMALLHICNEFSSLSNTPIRAIHINHNAQPLNKDWEEKVVSWCNDMGVSVEVFSLDVDYKSNFESVARDERQRCVASSISDGDWFLTAHHSNDLAEGLILSLARGSGVSGMSGMDEISHISKYISAKPILSLSKNDLYQYCSDNNIYFVEDPTNKESIQDRNFVRNEVIPLLESRWPNFIKSSNNTSKYIGEVRSIVDELIDTESNHISISGSFDSLSSFDNYAIRMWLKDRFKKSAGNNIINAIISAGMSNGGVVSSKGFNVGVWNNKIFDLRFVEASHLKCPPQVDYTKYSHELSGKVFINGMNKKIKKVFKQYGIAPWDKGSLQFGFVGEDLIYVGDKKVVGC